MVIAAVMAVVGCFFIGLAAAFSSGYQLGVYQSRKAWQEIMEIRDRADGHMREAIRIQQNTIDIATENVRKLRRVVDNYVSNN